jgi:cardiolipin synthase
MSGANGLTLARLLLVPVLALLLHLQTFGWALVVFAVAGVTDALDGYVARHWSGISRLGAVLDPVADKALVVTAYAVLAWQGWLPGWLALAVVGRDAVIVAGAGLFHQRTGGLEMAPTRLSKTNTALQLGYVAATLLDAALGAGWTRPEPGLALLVALTTVASGLQYVVVWLRKAAAHRRGAE